MKRIDEVASEIAAVFESLSLRYAIMGGLAVRIYALPRPTFDVDFTLAVDRERLDEVFDRVEALGYAIPEFQRAGWIERAGGLAVVKFQLIHDDLIIDVDVFLAESDFQNEILQRRQKHVAGDFQAWFVSPEDLILLKLLAGRRKDIVDVDDVFFIQGQLDSSYLQLWAARLGLESELAELFERHADD